MSKLWAFTLTLAIQAQTTALDRFVGKDLFKSPDEMRALTKIIGDAPKGYLLEPAPWRVWKINRDGIAYLAVLVEEELIIPGKSTACIQLFDAAAKRIYSWSFPTGWRMTPASVSMEFSREAGAELIVFRMDQYVNGRPIAKEYFGISGDQVLLVRLEGEDSKVFQAEHVFHNYEIGSAPNAETVEEWVAMLESHDQVLVLSGLAFLGGRHLSEPNRAFVDDPRESKHARLFQKLIESPRIRDRIGILAKSSNSWVREAAALAARGPQDRPLR